MRVAILGYGVEGRAAWRHFNRQGAAITIHDQNPALKPPPAAKAVLGPDYLKGLDAYDLVVRSPGVLPYQFQSRAPVTSVMNEFLRLCPAQTIGVTGTKGKGTTASLIAALLKELLAGQERKVFLGGNIGTPPLDFLPEIGGADFIVLELSNLQLWDIGTSPHVAVVLKITPEHLDWHRGDMDEYVATKANITAFQKAGDSVTYMQPNRYARAIATSSPGQKLPYFDKRGVWVDGETIKFQGQPLCPVASVRLLGAHNLQNVCAALGAVILTLGLSELTVEDYRKKITKVLAGFKGLEHRLQLVGAAGGVRYYDDSIGTTPETAIAALESFTEPKVIILGGSDKGLKFDELAQQVASSNVKHVVTLGETAAAIESALARVDYPKAQLTSSAPDMKAAVAAAAQAAQAGDVVLLSPASASFGMFADYRDRGRQFQRAVKDLGRGHS